MPEVTALDVTGRRVGNHLPIRLVDGQRAVLFFPTPVLRKAEKMRKTPITQVVVYPADAQYQAAELPYGVSGPRGTRVGKRCEISGSRTGAGYMDASVGLTDRPSKVGGR